jgi:hypothetical protein
MFCLKGTVSQDFLLQVFSRIVFPQASENPQILGLTKFVTFADLPHVGQFAICGPNIFCDLRICDLLTQIYYAPTTSAKL